MGMFTLMNEQLNSGLKIWKKDVRQGEGEGFQSQPDLTSVITG